MNFFKLFSFLAIMLFTTQTYSMERWPEKTPPPVPTRTYPTSQRPVPATPGTGKAPVAEWQASAIYTPEAAQTPTTQRARSSTQPSKKERELFTLIKEMSQPDLQDQPQHKQSEPVRLTKGEEHSLQKIEADFTNISANLSDIAGHVANFAMTTVQGQLHVTVGSVFTEGAPILKDIGSTSLLIANIIKHCRRLSKSKPEVRDLAQEKIHKLLNSESFINSFATIEKFIASGSAPDVIKKPLQKLVHEISELPKHIVNVMIKNANKP